MYSACLKTNDTSSEQYVSSDPLLEEWDCISHASFDSSFCLDACELESFASLPQSLAEGTAVATETNVTCPLTTMCTPSSKTVMEDSSISDTLNSSVMSLESLNSPNLHESLPFLPSEVEYRHQWRSLEYVPSTPESLAPLSPCESSVDDLNDPLDFPNANAPRPCQKQLKRGIITVYTFLILYYSYYYFLYSREDLSRCCVMAL
ncbi:hypothetical protein HMI54_013659 [Coelomomyces lativittatus]|nr:hypothetical protein HMI54_013659 [Coelomomyces lativittatus]